MFIYEHRIDEEIIYSLGFDSIEEARQIQTILAEQVCLDEVKGAHIQEFAKESDDDDTGDKLSILDIKAAIAEQEIPVSELFSKQDLSANVTVLAMVHEAELKTKQIITKENVILSKKVRDLQGFKDKTDTLELVETSKVLTDKSDRVIEYIKARLQSGRGVDLTGDLTDVQRQEKINEAIQEELTLMEEQGIVFKKKAEKGKAAAEPEQEEEPQYDTAETNPLIPEEAEEAEA